MEVTVVVILKCLSKGAYILTCEIWGQMCLQFYSSGTSNEEKSHKLMSLHTRNQHSGTKGATQSGLREMLCDA